MSNPKPKYSHGSKTDAARELGVTFGYIHNVVAGKYTPTERTLEILDVVEQCSIKITEKKEEIKKMAKEKREKYAN